MSRQRTTVGGYPAGREVSTTTPPPVGFTPRHRPVLSAMGDQMPRRTYLVFKAVQAGSDIFSATEAVSTTALEHPEWDMSQERSWSEWEARR